MNQKQLKLLPFEVKGSPKGTVFNNTIIKDGMALRLLAMLPAITAWIDRNKAALSSEISALYQERGYVRGQRGYAGLPPAGNQAKVNPSIADKALANYSGEALPIAALAPLIIRLLPSVIEAAPSVIIGIKKIISGEIYSQADMDLLTSEVTQRSLAQRRTGEALPMAALAPLIIGLLPNVIEAAPSVIGGIKNIIAGKALANYSGSHLDQPGLEHPCCCLVIENSDDKTKEKKFLMLCNF